MQPGDVVAGRFKLERPAGSGGMGTVFRGLDLLSGQPVAVKFVEARGRTRFAREIRVLRELTHPAIVSHIADGVDDAGEPYLVMDWLEGCDLRARLDQGALEVAEVLALAERLASALELAHHRGVVHRDVKPDNVFLVGGRVADAKLVDFGVARAGRAPDQLTRTGAMLGTLGYMAPEQARSARAVGPLSDLFALGCVLYECLAGYAPFSGDNAMAVLAKILVDQPPRLDTLRPDVPAKLALLVQSLLSKNPDERPPGASSVRRALAGVTLDETPPGARPAATISNEERRYVSVIFAQRRDSETDATWTPDVRDTDASRLNDLLADFGCSFVTLADGSLVTTLTESGSATDQALRSAACGLALAEQWNEGAVVLATGPAELRGQLPVGPVIDRASALLEHAEAGATGLYVDALTARLLDGRLRVREIGAPGTWVVEEGGGAGTRTLLGKAAPFVGRRRELVMLEATFEECVTESVARAVVVTGAPGVGKSRLARELRSRTEDGEVRWLTARADPLAPGTTYGLVAQLVQAGVGAQEGSASLDGILDVLDAIEDEDARVRVAELFAELLRAPIPAPSRRLDAARRDPGTMNEQLRIAFADWVSALASREPLVIELEDVHWGDRASIDVIDGALGIAAGLPFLVLALARPEVADALGRLWPGRMSLEVTLPALAQRDGERLVRTALGRDADTALVDALWQRSEGNPFYLEELIRHAATFGTLDDLPESVLAMAQARIAALAPEARRALRAASVFGETAWLEGLREMLGASPKLDGYVADLIEDELLEENRSSRFARTRELHFRHGIIREAAYRMLPELERAEAHRCAGLWLESAGSTNARAMAEHFERGGDLARAGTYWCAAAQNALDGFEFEAVFALTDRAFAAGGDDLLRGRAHALRCDASQWMGALEGVVDNGLAATGLLPAGSEKWSQAAGYTVMMLATRGQLERAGELEEALHAQSWGVPGPAAATGAFCYVWTLFYSGRREAANRVVVELRSALARDDLTPIARGWLHFLEGHHATFVDADPWRAYLELDRSTRAFDDVSYVHGAVYAKQTRGAFLLSLGAFEEGERELEEAVAFCERARLRYIAPWARLNLCMAPSRRRSLEETLRIQRECVDGGDDAGDLLIGALGRASVANTLARMGAHAEADRSFVESYEAARRFPPIHALSLAGHARLLRETGDEEGALARAREGRKLASRSGTYVPALLSLYLSEIEALLSLGRREEARALLAEARALVEDRANRIPDEHDRARFVKRLGSPGRLLALAEEQVAPDRR